MCAAHCEEAPVDHAEDALNRAPLFEALDEDGAKALRSMLADVELPRGDRLFHEGDAGDRLYVVLEGKIKLTRAASDGRENLLSVLGPGEMFGELSLFDPRPRTSSAVAVTDVRLAALAHRPSRCGPAPAAGARPAAAPRQRRYGRPGLHRRAWPGGQGPAGPGGEVRRAAGGRAPGAPRPHPGGTRAAGRGVAGDRQQGTSGFRGARLAPAVGQVRAPDRP